MILTDKELLAGIESGEIIYEKGHERYIGTNSIDVTLGRYLYKIPKSLTIDPKHPPQIDDFEPIDLIDYPEGYNADPQTLYLGETVERIGSKVYRPTMEGKSSLARLGIAAHWCAGYGDVGFAGHWTLEIVATNPTILRYGMKIAQIEFAKVTSMPQKNYEIRGRYTGKEGLQASKGV